MGCPANCLSCIFESTCNSAMYMDGCRFYPPVQKEKNFLMKLLGKLFS